jgi:hypothetical protein
MRQVLDYTMKSVFVLAIGALVISGGFSLLLQLP